MGSDSSKGKRHQETSQYGQIYLRTDKTAYYAGETVTGKIVMNMISHYPGNQLFLQLKGKEAVHIVSSEERQSHSEEVRHSERREIIKQGILVYSWDDTLSLGQLIIPFSFLLPQDLPSSFYQQGPRYLAFVEYQLEAFFRPNEDKIPKLKYKQSIILREKIKPITGDLSSNITTVLKTCGCCKQGSNVLRVNFEKGSYAPGEKAKVSIELDNSGTSLKNLKVVFSLKQSLELRVGGIQKTFDLVKIKKKLPGIPEGSNQNAGSLKITLPHSPTDKDFNRTINKKKPDKFALIELQKNHNVVTSNTSSSLITSIFYLEVSCPMSGCCATIPLAKFPIGILSPDFRPPAVNAPNNWHPVTLDSITLAFPSNKNQSLLKNKQSGQMIEGQMIQNSPSQPQQHLKVKISQSNDLTPKTGYNHTSFQNSP